MSPHHGSPGAHPRVRGLSINHDNVLHACKIIQDVLDNEGAAIKKHLGDIKAIAPGNDPISKQIAQKWNTKLATGGGSYVHHMGNYLRSLHGLLHNLRETAKSYGYSDDDIAKTFSGHQPGA